METKTIAEQSMHWSISEYAALITAIVTTIYTIGTFMLWWATRKSLKLTQVKLDLEREILETNFIQNIYRNFREVYSSIILDEESLKTIAHAENSKPKQIKKDYLGSFLINQAFEIYNLSKKNFLPSDFREKALLDVKALFDWDFIKERWEEVKEIHSTEFKDYVDSEILKIT